MTGQLPGHRLKGKSKRQRAWNARLRPCSEGCGRMTHARSGRCGHCQWQTSENKGKASALSGRYDGPDLVFAGDVCAHPLASRMPRWTGKWCMICNREVSV